MDQRLLPQQQLKVTPKQIAANYILQMSSMELQDVINTELQENPALDLEDATAGKFVLLPSGQVVAFAVFFTASLGVKDVS